MPVRKIVRTRGLARPVRPVRVPDAVRAVRSRLAIADLRRGAMTQAELARKVGVSPKYVQRVEAGKQNITIASLVRFANALGVHPEHLFAFRE
jgi:predicted transcriptional regulator